MTKIRKKKIRIRNANLPATFSMALVLFMIGLLVLTLFVARGMTNYVRENLTITLLLEDDINPQMAQKLSSFLKKADFVKSFDYRSKSDALKEHTEELGTNPEALLGWNPLWASYEIRLKANYSSMDSIADIEKQLQKYVGVKSIDYQEDMIDMVNQNVKKIGSFLLVIAIVLLLISIALINNTIRLRIYANRFLINTMRLVGAKPWFIRKPYIRQSMWSGFWASILALLLLLGVLYYLKVEFGIDVDVLEKEKLFILPIIIFSLGISLTAFSSYIAVGRYIRMRIDDMYFV